jgi:hypothetical protein
MRLIPLLCIPLFASDIVAQAAPQGTPVEIVRSARVCLGVAAGDPNLEFDGVVSPFLLPDGRVVVPSRGSNSIRVFRANGTAGQHVRTDRVRPR